MSEQSTETSEVIPISELKFPPIEYGVTEAALADLAERYKEPDASTDEGYEHCKDGVREMTAVRTAIETRRKDLKAPALDWGRDVDKQAKDIVRRVKLIEAPVREEKERVDEIKQTEAREAAEAEQKRIDDIRENIDKIEGTAREQAPDNTSAEYQTHIAWLKDLVIAEEAFGEFIEEAKKARDAALYKLQIWHQRSVKREEDDRKRADEKAELDRKRKAIEATEKKQKAEAERLAREQRKADERKTAEAKATKEKAEREEQEKLQAEKDRLEKIKDAIEIKRTIPDRAENMTSDALDRVIVAEKAAEPTDAEFQEFLSEAREVCAQSIATLEIMAKDARDREEKERRDEEARLPDKEKLARWCAAIADIPEPTVLNDKAQKILRRYGADLVKFAERLGADIEKL